MKILSIETSCDDTGISVMEAKGSIRDASFKILANNSNSQIKIHIPYGGVYPVLAKREHEKNLPLMLEASLKQASAKGGPASGRKKEKPIDAIAVTYGPGLEMCLWEGIVFAKNLAQKWNVPLISVNHMEGHMFSVFGKAKGTFKIPKIKTPILTLLVSGGHTQLVLTKKRMDYEIIGETLDDAVGEAFDKVARMLGLPYPGGPEISKLAELQRNKLLKRTDIFLLKNSSCSRRRAPKSFQELISSSQSANPAKIGFSLALPRPMLYSKNLDFSFSGLKTAVLYLIRDLGGIEKINQETKAQIALEFENAAIECLVHKTAKAIEKYKIKTLIVAGGVSANKYLKSEMTKITKNKIKLFFPAPELSGDNAIMIGIAGYLNYLKNKKKGAKIDNLKATGNLGL